MTIGFSHASSFPLHKRPNGLDGYLYAVALSTGLVKVGRTVNPRGRLGSHISHATKVGVDVLDVWLSPRHENYCANERALIKQLGAAERGNEYFRRDFADVVRTAESLSYVTRTEEERAERDALHWAALRANPLFGQLIGDMSEAGVPQYRSVRVPADLQVWALQAIFSPDLPAALSPTPPEDRAEVRECSEKVAERLGIPVGDVLDWSYLELLHHLGRSVIEAGWLDLKCRALVEGRHDLTDPGYFGGLDDDGWLINEDEFCYYAEPALLIDDEDDPRSVVVGLGSAKGVEATCLGVRSDREYVDVQLSADEVADLIGHLSATLTTMRTEVEA